jgi:hypothetical protein
MKMASSMSMSTMISLQSAQRDRKSRKLPSRTYSRPPVNHVLAIAHRADVKKRGPPPSSGVSYPHRSTRYLMITGVQQPSRSRSAGRRARSASPLQHNVTFPSVARDMHEMHEVRLQPSVVTTSRGVSQHTWVMVSSPWTGSERRAIHIALARFAADASLIASPDTMR